VRNHHIPVNLLPTCPSQRHRCLMILSVRAMSPRAAWAANASASLPFVTRIVILRHSNWKNNYRLRQRLLPPASASHSCCRRGRNLWQPPSQLMGKNISVCFQHKCRRLVVFYFSFTFRWQTRPAKRTNTSRAAWPWPARRRAHARAPLPVLPAPSRSPPRCSCVFWNAEYNAAAALPALFDVFLRDTQKVQAKHLITLHAFPALSFTPSVGSLVLCAHSLGLCSLRWPWTPIASSRARSCMCSSARAACTGHLPRPPPPPHIVPFCPAC
jgi:hypothetical protein